MPDKYPCTICGEEGNTLAFELYEQMFYSTLCLEHDVICLQSLLLCDFQKLGLLLMISANIDAPTEFQNAIEAAETLAVLRAAAYGITADDLEAIGEFLEHIPADPFDMEVAALLFLHERNLLNSEDNDNGN
jgi:hypothetical protein